MREKYVKQRSYYEIDLTNVLDHTFPEFKPFLVMLLVLHRFIF